MPFGQIEYHGIELTKWHSILVATLAIFCFFVFKVKNLIGRQLSILARLDDGAFEYRYKRWSKLAALVIIACPSTYFVLALRNDYVPAVLGMAIIAIIVAADHEAALDDTPHEVAHAVEGQLKHTLKEATDTFSETVHALSRQSNKLTERLAGYSESYRWWDAVTEASNDPDSSGLYRLSAVIRHWELPRDMLVPEDSVTAKVGAPPQSPVEVAFKELQSLILQARQSAISEAQMARLQYPRFVCHGPARLQGWVKGSALMMRSFYGLVYALTMLYKTANQAFDEDQKKDPSERQWTDKDPRPARIRVGRAPIWVHVINDDVYHIIPARDQSLSLARKLHDDFGSEQHSVRHESANAYEDAVVFAFHRAMSAEAYVASLLLATQISKGKLAELSWNVTINTRPEIEGFRLESFSQIGDALALMGAKNPEFAVMLLKEAEGFHDDELTNAIVHQLAQDKIDLKEHGWLMSTDILEQYLRERCRFLNRHAGSPDTIDALVDRLAKEEGQLGKFLLDEVSR